jgi:hypothetical protein
MMSASFFVLLVVILAGMMYFRQVERQFADVI